MPKSGNEAPSVAKLVEKQMRNWELARAQKLDVPRDRAARVHDFISMSYQHGSGGETIAERLGEVLHRPVFDRRILVEMAANDDVRHRLYASLDEHDVNWFEEVFRAVAQDEFKRNDYFHRLTTTVLAIAHRGPAVFLGRATDLILPRDRGFRVKLVSPRSDRVRRYATKHALDEPAARANIQRLEADRERFVRKHFGGDPNDPARYDLLVNLASFTRERAVELILAARESRLKSVPARDSESVAIDAR